MQNSKEEFKPLLTKEEDEEEPVCFKKTKDAKRTRRITCSSSPEPTKRGRKRIILNPNKTDKAGRTKLFYATSQGQIEKVKELVNNGANVNFKDNAGWTPLHEAALKGQYEVGRYLIQCGADVNSRGFGLDTPLHDASSNARIECIRLLVQHGADVFALNESKQRPLDVCHDRDCRLVLKAKMKQLDRLVARDRDGRSLLHHACIENDLEKVKSLIEQGADANAKDNKKWTPLHLACLKGHLNIVKALIHQGAVVNILGSEHMDTPLHQASKEGHQDVVLYLTQSSDVDVNTEDRQGQTAYDVSISYPVIRQILTARMDEVRLEKEACNALDEIASKTASRNEAERQLTREQRKIQHVMRVFAKLEGEKKGEEKAWPAKGKKKSVSVESDDSYGGHEKKTNMLDPFKRDTSGRTSLHKYAARGNQDRVQTLLELGADPNKKDHAGWTPIHEAALRGRIEVVKILLKHGADANAKGGTDFDTPLHDATENNHCDVIELLLEHGANPLTRNKNNLEPLDIAIENDFVDIIMVLQAALPVTKRKRRPRKMRIRIDDEDEQEVDNQVDSDKEIAFKPLKKKRKLIQAADLEKQLTKKANVKLEQDNEPISGKEMVSSPTETCLVDPHSPIPTPPPVLWLKKEHTGTTLPLYSVQLFNGKFYVVDLQVSIFLGITLRAFWDMYPRLSKISITVEQKRKLWRPLKVWAEELNMFLSRELYFVHFEDVIDLIKSDYAHLSQRLIRVTLDLDYKLKRLPPKMMWKSKYRSYC